MSVRPPYPLVSYRLELNFVHSNTRSRTPTPTLPVVGCNWDREPCSLHCLCRSHFP